VTRSRTVLTLLVVVPALAVMVVGAPAAGASGGDGATAETAAKKKGKKKAAKCKAAKGKKGKRKAKRSVAETAARKKGRKGKKKAAKCKAAKGKGKGKGKKGPKTKQPTGGLSDGTYEDAANKVKMSIQDGATKVTVKLTVSSPALLTLTLSGALGSDGSAAGSSSAGVLGAVNWELQLSGTRYRLQYMFVGIGDQKVISGTLR
jgi:hypothetical protein